MMHFAVVLLLLCTFSYLEAQNKLPLDYGPTFGDALLPAGDYMKVPLGLSNPPLHFIDHTYNTVFIDVDGAIWLGTAHCDEDCPIPMQFPYQSGDQMVACYWADADSTLNPNSAVYYRNAKDQISWSKIQSYMEKALGTKAQFDFTSPNRILIIVTWLMTTYSGGSATTPTNTFQCALASDGVNSYTIFSFSDINWTNSPGQVLPAAVGVDDGTKFSNESSLVMPYSWTPQVSTLAAFTNFKTKTPSDGPDGWSMVSKCTPVVPPYYPIPPNTPTKHCYDNGDPHYYTFDGLTVDNSFGGRPANYPYGYPTSNQPPGNYIMMGTTNCQDTNWPPVSVVGEVESLSPNAPQNPRTTSGVHGVIVTFYWNTASIGTKNQIRVEMRDGKLTVGTMQYTSYDCPYKLCQNYTFSVRPYSTGFKLTTSFGLTVSYANWQLDIYLAYLPVLQGAVFGYCGNMNGKASDDNYCWDPDDANYANYQYCWPESYLADHTSDWGPGYISCPYTFDKLKKHEMLMKTAQFDQHKTTNINTNATYAQSMCSVLTDPNGVFKSCQSVVDLSGLYASCVVDLSLMNGDQAMLCTYGEQAARYCMAALNLTSLAWRSADFCPKTCPANSHYSAGFPSCVATCDDPYAAQFCFDQNIEGCQCDDGTLFDYGACVTPDQCGGCLDDQGNTVPVGGAWYTMDCSKQCSCASGGGVTCQAHPCDANAVCIADGSSATCKCSKGYAGDGFYCSKTDNCLPSNQCQNGATCVTQQQGYICVCDVGYEGTYCQTKIDHCSPNPCLNNGQCINSRIGFTCNCTYSYTGTTCNLNVDWCASFPCQNLGTCTSSVSGYKCTCPTGFYGNDCESNTTETSTSVPTTTIGVESTTTSHSEDSCLTFACLNNGTCRMDDGTPFCQCAWGFGGLHCEHPVNFCDPDPCVHGDCVDEDTGYVCKCCEGYTGTNCDEVDHCSPNPCENGGTCINNDQGYTCQCPPDFIGDQCQTYVSTTPTMSTPNPGSFNCTGLPNGNYPLSRTECMNDYIVCVNGQSSLAYCTQTDFDFDPVSYLCAYKCFIKACIDASCHPSFLHL